MADSFEVSILTKVLADQVELAEALGFPEISALGENERQCQAAFQAKATAILEDRGLSPVLSLHRRLIAVEPQVGHVDITLDPPSRSPDWQKPIVLHLPVVRWVEADDMHQAYVPALGILVFAPREALLDDRIQIS